MTSAENWPGKQLAHENQCRYSPGEHEAEALLQEVDPSLEYFPFEQSLHFVLPALLENVFFSQEVQKFAPGVEDIFPAGQFQQLHQ